MLDHDIFELGDTVLQPAAALRNAKLAHHTYGGLSATRDMGPGRWPRTNPSDNQFIDTALQELLE